MAKKHQVIERLPWLPSKSCCINLKFFETLKDTLYISEGFRFVAFVVLEILWGGGFFSTLPLMLGVGTKTLGAWRVNYIANVTRQISSMNWEKTTLLLQLSKFRFEQGIMESELPITKQCWTTFCQSSFHKYNIENKKWYSRADG